MQQTLSRVRSSSARVSLLKAPLPSKYQQQRTVRCSSSFDAFVTTGLVATSLASILVSAVPPETDNNTQYSKAAEKQLKESGNFNWGIAGVVSCIPLFNWLAWIAVAFEKNNDAIYYAYAAIYTVPLLRNGFDQDVFSIAMLLLGVVHVQVARTAATEPDTIAELGPLISAGRIVRGAASIVGSLLNQVVAAADSSLTQQKQQLEQQQLPTGPGASRALTETTRGGRLELEKEPEEKLAELELKQFDRRMMEIQRQASQDEHQVEGREIEPRESVEEIGEQLREVEKPKRRRRYEKDNNWPMS